MALDPVPQAEPITQIDATDRQPARPLYLNGRWLTWLYSVVWSRLGICVTRLGTPTTLTAQHASIGATALQLPGLTAGRYRVSWYARVTTPDPVSSSLTVTIGWTESALPLQISGAALTGNLTTSVQSGSVLVEADGASAITYATTYVSNTPGTMQYRLSVVAEAVPS